MMQSSTTYNVRASFANMEVARRAIAALERGGVPGSDIRLEGRSAEKASVQADTSASDEAFIQQATRTVVGGAAIGAGVGALVGLLAGLIFFGGSWLAIATTVAAGGAGGGALGFIVNAMASMQQTDAAELTYHDVDDSEVYVTVRTDVAEDYDTAVNRLRDSDPVAVERLDGDGKPLA